MATNNDNWDNQVPLTAVYISWPDTVVSLTKAESALHPIGTVREQAVKPSDNGTGSCHAVLGYSNVEIGWRIWGGLKMKRDQSVVYSRKHAGCCVEVLMHPVFRCLMEETLCLPFFSFAYSYGGRSLHNYGANVVECYWCVRRRFHWLKYLWVVENILKMVKLMICVSHRIQQQAWNTSRRWSSIKLLEQASRYYSEPWSRRNPNHVFNFVHIVIHFHPRYR